MRLGIFAKTFAGTDPFPVLTAAKAAGYECVQYNMACSGLPSMPKAVPLGTAEAISAAMARTGIEIVAISATYNMIHPDPGVRQHGQRNLEQIAAVARAVGAPLLTLCTGTRDPHDQWRNHPDNATPEAWRDLVDSMGAALAIADRYDLDLGIEPELANVVNSAATAHRLIDELGSKRLKVVFDAANLFEAVPVDRQRAIVADAIDMLADRIALAHAKDRADNGNFVRAGTGVLDYGFYLRKLREAGFDGPLITHGLSSEETPAVAMFLANQVAATSSR